MSKPRNIPEIQARLDLISQELIALIQEYQLDAEDPLEVIPVARQKINVSDDYIRFLELSLEGCLLGEAASFLETGK
ncbi:hypothetical protein O4H49_17520 [Kiloniella laminariae]|uniref:Uncharacterized protein n=1 Tax=Kiloniella laminariae TaxID=454162 RepID=A0ABT4LN79_9PROT|nr:hypothetical protein [Kiloniella laminariae]MCZ4282592.1 hypothetical protein [Kiloniella laminariae]